MEQSERIRAAFTRQAESFSASAVANASDLLEAIVACTRPSRTQRWLDAACGPGIVSRHMATLAGSVLGIDATPAMVDTARRAARAAGLENVRFEVADATATSLPDESFDGALTRFSIHHIPLPSRLFGELARVVRRGGTVTVVDHLADPDPEARSWALEIERLRDPSHWAALSDARLRELGRTAGLELTHEQRLRLELDFDDWLQRGTDSQNARELVELALTERPGGSEYFRVSRNSGRRTLALQVWLGVWRR